MKFLVTAGTVYGRLDDNKLVGNRVRGIWAVKFAKYLAEQGHTVKLLVPDTMRPIRPDPNYMPPAVQVISQNGFHSYQEECLKLAKQVDGAVMAAAVVNWIPESPIKGKMSTEGFAPGDKIDIPFILAPRVINQMKEANPKLTLIGCKMLIGSTYLELEKASGKVIRDAKCAAVVANDMEGLGLRVKHVIHKDGAVITFDNEWDGFNKHLQDLLTARYYRTDLLGGGRDLSEEAKAKFTELVEQHHSGFLSAPVHPDLVFGSLAVFDEGYSRWAVSPREKRDYFTAEDAVPVLDITEQSVSVNGYKKPTLNAALLIRFAEKFGHRAVLHQHRQLPGLPTAPYALPGTVEDSDRRLLPEYRNGFNIKGHGFILPVEVGDK